MIFHDPEDFSYAISRKLLLVKPLCILRLLEHTMEANIYQGKNKDSTNTSTAIYFYSVANYIDKNGMCGHGAEALGPSLYTSYMVPLFFISYATFSVDVS